MAKKIKKQAKSKERFTENSTLDKIMKTSGAEEVLQKYHVPCLHCAMASYEMQSLKIGEVAKVYGLDIKEILKELNALKKNK